MFWEISQSKFTRVKDYRKITRQVPCLEIGARPLAGTLLLASIPVMSAPTGHLEDYENLELCRSGKYTRGSSFKINTHMPFDGPSLCITERLLAGLKYKSSRAL